MTFKPEDHLKSIKDKPYLGAHEAITWFYKEHPLPEGRIVPIIVDSKESLVRCEIYIGDVLVSAADVKGDGTKSLEKLQTNSVRRALAFAGYGTVAALAFDDTDDDSVQKQARASLIADEIPLETARNALQPAQVKRVGIEDKVLLYQAPAQNYKPGHAEDAILLDFEITEDGQVYSRVKLPKSDKIFPVWSTQEEFVIQGYMDKDDPQWSQTGTGTKFHEHYPELTIVANQDGYWDIKANSLQPKELLGKLI